MTFLDPHPVLIGSITAHGAAFALGAVVGSLVFAALIGAKGVNFARSIEKSGAIFLFALLSARLGYLVLYSDVWVSGAQLLSIWEGGLLSYTGIMGALLAAAFFTRKLAPDKRRTWFDTFFIAGLIGWGIGRIGNYYAVESYGILSSSWEAFYGRVPIQLFESFGCFILAFFLIRIRTRLSPGFTAWIALVSYLTLRTFLDIFREDTDLSRGTPTVAALIFLVMSLIAYAIWIHRRLARR